MVGDEGVGLAPTCIRAMRIAPDAPIRRRGTRWPAIQIAGAGWARAAFLVGGGVRLRDQDAGGHVLGRRVRGPKAGGSNSARCEFGDVQRKASATNTPIISATIP